ncbi:unnamed protein product [Paramecium octaurelia]|uniref:Uncharacterized protein n=1 Tax=Paramecium octaurelia TaxID=43137 RepID=A0A8S1UFE9_PAROT|nr:unnamed protein product [Paramecium octaurelia]
MNQKFQQKKDFKCKEHPQESAIFWCKSADCHENRIFCIQCQKLQKHYKHFNEDVDEINKLNQFLITKSQNSKDLIKDSKIQLQQTALSLQYLISGLQFHSVDWKTKQMNSTLINNQQHLSLRFYLMR